MDDSEAGTMSDETAPTVDYRRIQQLYEEFMQHWNRLHAFYLDASAGFNFVFEHVALAQGEARSFVQDSELDSEEFQDTRQFTYDQIFAESFCLSGMHRGTQGKAKQRNQQDGVNVSTLGQLCVVSLYDFWNDYLRREYVIAKGLLDPDEKDNKVIMERLNRYASIDFWGDMRYLRNSIAHKRGIASSYVTKCKIIKWFKPGDPVTITSNRMEAIFMAARIFSNALHKEQFPQTYIYL
jgi:hypothetical protein